MTRNRNKRGGGARNPSQKPASAPPKAQEGNKRAEVDDAGKAVRTAPVASEGRMGLWQDRMGKYSVRALQTLIIAALILGACYGVAYLNIIVIPIVLALILAASSEPIVRLFSRFVPRGIAAGLTLIGGLSLIAGIVTAIVFAVRSEMDNLTTAVTSALKKIQNFLASDNAFFEKEKIDELFNTLNDFLLSADFGSKALGSVGVVTEVLTSLVLMVIVWFYFMADGQKIWSFVLKFFKGESYQRAERAGRDAVSVMGNYLRGTASVAAVDAILIGIVLAVLGVPLALPLAVIVFLGAFIPIIGATLSGTLAALVALVTNDLTTALVVVGAIVVIQQLEGNFLAPVLLGNALKIHSLVVLLVLPVGAVVGGIIGMLLAAPVAAVVWIIASRWDDPLDKKLLDKRKP